MTIQDLFKSPLFLNFCSGLVGAALGAVTQWKNSKSTAVLNQDANKDFIAKAAIEELKLINRGISTMRFYRNDGIDNLRKREFWNDFFDISEIAAIDFESFSKIQQELMKIHKHLKHHRRFSASFSRTLKKLIDFLKLHRKRLHTNINEVYKEPVRILDRFKAALKAFQKPKVKVKE